MKNVLHTAVVAMRSCVWDVQESAKFVRSQSAQIVPAGVPNAAYFAANRVLMMICAQTV